MNALLTEGLTYKFKGKDGTQVLLRPVQLSDAEDIIKYAKQIIVKGEYIQKEHERSLDEEKDFIREMQTKGNMYMGVQIDGEVVGIARVIKDDLRMKMHTGVFRTWLSDSAQGKGIGKKMIEYTLEWCRLNELKKLWLTVFSSNKIAHHIYTKYGFITEGVQKDQLFINGEYMDEIFMAYFFDPKK